jgi:hypothetical protein
MNVVLGTGSARDVLEIITRQLDQVLADAPMIPAESATRR